MLILKKSKVRFVRLDGRFDLQLLESRSSMFHSVISFSNALMNAGTSSDEFLRGNLEWLAHASNWSKFSATAALGVIHRV